MSMPNYPPYQPGPTSTCYPQRRGIPLWVKILIGLVLLGGLTVVGICGGLFYFISVSPETYVVSGSQLPDRYVRQIRDLGLLDDDERVYLFYSDGFFTIDEGMYFVTDSHLTLYCKDWAEPRKRIPYDQIESVTISYSDDWMIDSTVWVNTRAGQGISFPLSMEGGGDRRFIQRIREATPDDVTIEEDAMDGYGALLPGEGSNAPRIEGTG